MFDSAWKDDFSRERTKSVSGDFEATDQDMLEAATDAKKRGLTDEIPQHLLEGDLGYAFYGGAVCGCVGWGGVTNK